MCQPAACWVFAVAASGTTRLTFPCQTVRGEGLLALYKGVLPPLVMTGGINCVLFGLQVIDTHSAAVFYCGYVVGPC